ncbi:MAG TPA: efflux RND transporter periplasmic adaptor subunit [Candidatus Limnocylindrales bacterium]|jgi:macrolide-specific efflux system membrane fusion protein
MKLKLLVIVGLVVVAGAAVFVSVGGGLPLAGNANATQYLTAAASTGDVTDSVAATGTIAATKGYDLGFGAAPVLSTGSSAAAGTGTWSVTDVTAEVGKAVKAGEVLAKASTADLQEQLAMADSTLKSATIQLRQANKTLTDASGTDAIRQARVNRFNAVNGKRQAQQSVDDLHKQIGYATLKAPIDGVVTAVNIAKGLDSTGTAISIASSAYEVTADVVETDISSMSVGQGATIAVDAIGATISGKVTSIAPTAASSSGSSSVVSYPVTVSLTGAPTTLRAGMTADITIVTASASNVLTIPAAALRGTAGDYRVQVMGADGTPTLTPVTVGLVTSTTAEIKTGLSEGDTVITGTAADRIASSNSTTNSFGGNGRGGFGGGGGVVVQGRP